MLALELDVLVGDLPSIVTACDVVTSINARLGIPAKEIPSPATTYGWKDILLAMKQRGYRATLWLAEDPQTKQPTRLEAGFCLGHN